jgi:hypothetical protein
MTAPDLTNERLAAIIEAAGKATPGPWKTKPGANSHCFGVTIAAPSDPGLAFSDGPDATHIANCDPQTIAAMAGEIVRLRALLANMQEATFALTALEAAIPGLTDVLDGKAVVLPVEATDDMIDGMVVAGDCFGTPDRIYAAMLAASPYRRQADDRE